MTEATRSTRVKAPDISSLSTSTGSSRANEVSASNLPRRAATNDRWKTGRTDRKFVKCKKTVNISSFNVRTLNQPHNIGELTVASSKFDLDVVCIQEHRIGHEDDVEFTRVDENHTLVTSSAMRNSIGASIGGVGFLMNSHSLKCLSSVEKINPRIVSASFTGNPATTIISCYSPTNCSDEDDISGFYRDLADTISNIPSHNLVLLCGDFNAQLGNDDFRFSFHDSTNRNGSHLQDFITEFNLIVTNTHIQKPRRKLWTFQYPNASKAQLDYILVRRKWANSIQNVEAYNTFKTVGSDHRVITAKVQLSLRAPNVKKNASRSLNFRALHQNQQLQEMYAVEVFNHFDALNQETQEETTQDMYNFLETASVKAAKNILPKKPKRTFKNISQTPKVKAAREVLNSAIDLDCNIQQSKELLKAAYTSEEKTLLEDKIEQIQQASFSSRHSKAWKIVNEITGRKETKSAQIPGTPNERKEAWLHHFTSLLGNPPTIPDHDFTITPVAEEILPIKTSEFSYEELDKALQQTKAGGAVGLDSIPLELWKSPKFRPHLLHFCNRTLLHGDKPRQWSTGGIIPIPKKGDLSQTSNYRGITLSSIGAKIYNRMLLNRIRPFVDPLLRWNQNGFREHRSTISQILALRRIIEGMKAKNLPLALIFIDYSKAFDSIHRDRMFEILKAYGLPDIIIEAIRVIYEDSSAVVLTPDGETSSFPIQAGVLQGDTLAPFLFIVVLDYVMRHALKDISLDTGIVLEERRSRRHPETRLHDLDFADDISLLATAISSAETLLQSIEDASNCVGLYFNKVKTKTLLVNIPPTTNVTTLDGTEIQNITEFIYLGSSVPDSFQDFKYRKAQAWSACNKLTKIWKSSLERATKIRFFRACVESILIYGSETWTITQKFEDRINGCYTQLLRRVLNISWRDHIPNTVVYGDIPRLSETIRKRRLQFAGHCMRSTNQPISKLIFWTPSGGHPKRGRKTLSYPDTIVKDIGLEPTEIQQLMKDRATWHQFAATASGIPSKDDQ